MIDDLLLPADDSTEPDPPGLLLNAACTDPADLGVIESLYRSCPVPGAYRVMFTTEDPDGVEIFEDRGEAERWRRLMGWPERTRLPTVAEASAWQAYTDATAQAWAWDARAAGRVA